MRGGSRCAAPKEVVGTWTRSWPAVDETGGSGSQKEIGPRPGRTALREWRGALCATAVRLLPCVRLQLCREGVGTTRRRDQRDGTPRAQTGSSCRGRLIRRYVGRMQNVGRLPSRSADGMGDSAVPRRSKEKKRQGRDQITPGASPALPPPAPALAAS